MAKPTNLLGAEHRLIHHITATHILPTSGGHEKMSYQDLYIMWHIVTGKPLNLPHLIMKNMLRATSKVEGALPYGMVITKILSHFGIVFGNEVVSRLDVRDIYNASGSAKLLPTSTFPKDLLEFPLVLRIQLRVLFGYTLVIDLNHLQLTLGSLPKFSRVHFPITIKV
ncbi:hypothetical protein CFOL_v3_01998 [Cephalotus follicularis]|uniref:Putative plant transposon protein domain-containing protein n=1 Tax=Cephalotus follicularis TaxID=3775 RepID=A0A1Q3AS16_CEPFO|nr:hypothetical protein CFOL_v3_01998 [Cephalotus follicularis]